MRKWIVEKVAALLRVPVIAGDDAKVFDWVRGLPSAAEHGATFSPWPLWRIARITHTLDETGQWTEVTDHE